MLKRLLLLPLLLCLSLSGAEAQVSVPNTFVSGTTIKASEVNANFAKLGDALNRTGGTMTGNLIFGSDNVLDIGASGTTRPRRVYVGTEVVSPLFSGGAVTVTGALQGASLAFSGGTGNITGAGAINASGTITGNLFSGSGASLTSIPETAITDGSTFPRLSGTESVSGAWTFTNAGTAITVSTGASSFQAVSGTTANFSSTVTGGTFSGSGASLTSIPETAITDGSVLARVGGNETISGTWAFSTVPTIATLSAKPSTETTIIHLGGDWREFQVSNAYPSGATYDKLAPGTMPFMVTAANVIGGHQLEVILRGTTGSITGYACLVNLSDGAPDTCVTTSEVSVTLSTTGVFGRSSSTISFASGQKLYGLKVKTSSATEGVAVIGARIVRVN